MPNYFPIHITIIIKRFNFQNTTIFKKKKKKKLRILRTSLNSRKAGLPCNHSSAAKFVRPNARTRGSTIPTSLSRHFARTCAAAFLARACIMHAETLLKNIYSRYEGPKCIHPIISASACRTFPLSCSYPPPLASLESLSALERTTVPSSSSSSLSLSSRPPPFPMVDSTFAWNAFI